ncbi:RraA family protein [Neomoorella mulderi]|jgi:regulator of RNase E activity RraA|uniref:Putative 4-hydroxy-4-methyl-2-oxoglutarate aldolase n=1 Tax=Moorella mulderi DSM 14980 TaxID=1122241 RepID=A0A151ASN1_9FIRM|nr:RraA family protein [Moorella mulderi]KYH30615.1 4-hydroxy-4-methyl-2-oxoglutarate aldolase [Moorella mulderi DSM 14980]
MELKELVERFRKLATASVSDAVDKVTGERGFMTHEMKPIFNCKIVGPAVTVKEVFALKNEGPKLALQAIDSAEEGSVLVISAENAKDYALFGGLMGTGAKVNGFEGAVLDGGVRDVNELKELNFPVFSRSIVPSTTLGRIVTVASNIPVACGGVMVHPGDIIVGDTDGVVVVPRAKAEEVLLKAEEIEETERKQTEDIKELKSIVKAVEKWARI